MNRLFLSALVFFLAAGRLLADDEAPTPRKLTLSPAKAPSPALKYRLLPELIEQKPGNAAEHYKKAVDLLNTRLLGEARLKAEEWVTTPRDKFPKTEVKKLLKEMQPVLDAADAARACESCDWGLSERLRKDSFGTLIPEIQEMRTLNTLLLLRIRLEQAEGRLDQGLRSAQVGLAVARHVGDSPTLICLLVGVANATRILDELDQLIQEPGAPNLYWALTDLPRPFLDMRKPLQGERLSLYAFFPGLTELAIDLQAGPLSQVKIKLLSGRLTSGGGDITGFSNRWTLGLAILRKHEVAKRALIQGRPRDKVEAMPHVQVALLHAFLEYETLFDELMKCQSLPYWEARPIRDEADRRTRESRVKHLQGAPDAPALPLAPLLMPAVNKVMNAQTRIDRRLATLRTIEAIRLHAASHDGKLPANLAEIKEVKVPDDPVTGKPFQYELKGGIASLSAPPFPNESANAHNSIRYELTMRR